LLWLGTLSASEVEVADIGYLFVVLHRVNVQKLKTPRLRGFATPSGATLRENMESVESVCLEAGGALRLKLGQVQIPSGAHTVLRTTYAFESPRAEG